MLLEFGWKSIHVFFYNFTNKYDTNTNLKAIYYYFNCILFEENPLSSWRDTVILLTSPLKLLDCHSVQVLGACDLAGLHWNLRLCHHWRNHHIAHPTKSQFYKLGRCKVCMSITRIPPKKSFFSKAEEWQRNRKLMELKLFKKHLKKPINNTLKLHNFHHKVQQTAE